MAASLMAVVSASRPFRHSRRAVRSECLKCVPFANDRHPPAVSLFSISYLSVSTSLNEELLGPSLAAV